jgi:dTDP-4-dehydrorhamnose reductase
MKKRLLVTGYGGFVAGSLVWQAGYDWDVVVFSRSKTPEQGDRFRGWQFDLRDTAKLRETFAESQPDVVVHTAALANIDYCQSHQDEAERVNVGVTRELARLCGDSGAKMILCSTDTVFDGEKGMYTEQDQPHAVNFYAETKIRAEQIVRELVDCSVMARLSLVMGLPVLGTGNSFLAKLSMALKAGQEVRVPKNEIRTPVDVITLGQALLELAANDFTGTLHLAGSTRLNRHDMACRIAQRLGHSAAQVVATDSNAMEGRAPRPNDASLDNTMAHRVLQTPMQTLMNGLNLVITSKEKQENE